MATGRDERTSTAADEDASALFGALIGRARLVLAWERLWPRLAPLLGVAGVFVAVSWFGLFSMLPAYGRWILLAAFGMALLASFWPLRSLRPPSLRDALGRLDRETGLAHRPASTLADRLATVTPDPVSRALWEAHRRDARGKAGAIRLGLPAPGLARHDRYALRVALALALVVGFFFAGGDRIPRLMSAFSAAAEAEAVAPVRIDAWVTPPAYTRRAPILLTADRGATAIPAPQDSILVVRVAGDASAEIVATGNVADAPAAAASPAASPAGVVEKRLTLKGDAAIAVRRGGHDAASFRFAIIADRPPTIAFEGPIKSAARGAMTLSYKVEDDYGVVGAEARIALKPRDGARPLYEPPKIALSLPTARSRGGVASSTRDVSEHPFAGAAVAMTLVARDDAGNEGLSAPQETSLPGRTFVKPLARALVEQRRQLALDANAKPAVVDALDALMIAPDMFTKDAGTYLGLRTAWTRLREARSDDQLRGVVDYLWQIALRIEEGDLSNAERQLKAAQEKLREALEKGASPEEIEKLTQELREALNNFLQEYAQRLAQQQRNGQQPNEQQQQADRTVTPESLNDMLDKLQDMAKSGARDQAQQLLSELNDILENLQSPDQQGEMAQDPEMQEMQRSIDEMSKMIQRQQKLRDQTFREGQKGQTQQDQSQQGQGRQGDQAQQGEDGQGQQGQGQDGQGQDGQQGQGQQGQAQQGNGRGGQGGLEGLRQQQEALRRQLEQMQKRLGEMGVPGGEELGKAGEAMRDAEGQLGQGEGEGAVGSQGKALEALRRGAQGLAQQMQQAQQGREGQGQGQGQPGRAQRTGRGPGNGDDRDPLGRPTRSRGYSDGTVKVPGRGETDLQRAARVLDELRRRFSDPARPQLELDYIDRLLRGD